MTKNALVLLFTLISTLISYVSVSQPYDTAIAVLQPLKMPVHNGFGTASTNYWIQDSTGYVQDSVTFPATRNYRFDFTGHAPTFGAGLHPDITIRIDGVLKATINVSKTIDSIWAVNFSVAAGKHAVRIAYTDVSTGGVNKVFMGLLYISSSNTTIPVKYPAIVRRNLPVYGSGFISSNDFTSGHLRGFNSGQIIKPNRTISASEWADMNNKYHANLVRCWVTVTRSGNAYTVDARNIDTLDAYIKRAKANNVYLVVAITEDNNSTFWGLPIAKTNFINRIVDVVRRYKDSTEIAGFAITNEPDATANLGEFCKFAQDAALAMRRSDTNHVIIFPSMVNNGSTDLYTISEPIAVPKVIYENHFYLPFEITHQGINTADSVRTEYPNSSASPFWNPAYLGTYGKPQMQAELKITRVVAFSNKYNIPIYVGEYGCVDYAPNWSSARYVSDAIDIFEANNWSWTITAYHTFEPWDIEIPSGQWYGFTYVKASPQVSNYFALHAFRTDTTLTAIKLKQWFVFNSNVIIVGFSPSTYHTTAALGRRIRLTVTLSTVSASNVSVHLATANGTALAGSDYTQIPSTKVFVIPAGITSRTFCVSIAPDAVADPTESFTVNLSSPTGATIGTGTATITIN